MTGACPEMWCVIHSCYFFASKWPSLSVTNIEMIHFFLDSREMPVLRRELNILIFGTRGHGFRCWRNAFLTQSLKQRTKSDSTESMAVESFISMKLPATGYASLIK